MSNRRRRSATSSAMEEERRSPTDPLSNLENIRGLTFIPNFYSIIMSSVLLVFPKNFVEEYGGELSGIIELHLPVDDGKWYIGLKKSGKVFYLHGGWENFMNHYSIRFGWFLLFKYKGNSVFDVHIFDLTATEIQYPSLEKSSNIKGDAVCKEEFDDAEEIREKAAENNVIYKTVNPSFNVTLRGNNVRERYIVNLPTEFMRKHMNGCPEYIKIVDSDKKMWRVRCMKYGKKSRLCKGWRSFVKEKGLQIGDVCVFELVKKNAIFKVDVFYANK